MRGDLIRLIGVVALALPLSFNGADALEFKKVWKVEGAGDDGKDVKEGGDGKEGLYFKYGGEGEGKEGHFGKEGGEGEGYFGKEGGLFGKEGEGYEGNEGKDGE